MSKFYFYCPNCGFEKEVNELPKGTVGNLRDGFGIGISHYECKKCHNLDAGFMREIYEDLDEKVYYRSVIGLYQGIRGFAKENYDGQ